MNLFQCIIEYTFLNFRKSKVFIDVQVENTILKVEKEILYKNKIFKQIIEDRLFDGRLILNEKVKKDGFMTLIYYYDGKEIAIEKKNICSLFLVCFYYNEEDILEKCIKSIISIEPDVDITITLLNVIIPIRTCEKYHSLFEYIITKCVFCFNQIIKHHILKIDIVGIIFILETQYLEIDSENLLVDQIKWYYEHSKEDIVFDSDLINITSLINWNRVDDSRKNINMFQNYSKSQTVTHDRMYIFEFPEFSKENVFIDVLKMYYFHNFEFYEIEIDFFNKFELIDGNKWIFKKCLLSSNMNLTFSVLKCLSDAKYHINMILDEEQIRETIVILFREYESNSHQLKDYVMRCLTVFSFCIYIFIL